MRGNFGVGVVRAECEPCPFNRVLLFETPGDGEVPHGLLHVIGEWAGFIEVGVGEGIPNTTMTPGKYLPIASVPLLPPWSAR